MIIANYIVWLGVFVIAMLLGYVFIQSNIDKLN